MTQRFREIRGFAFDLDGTIWAGPRLIPGAMELVDSVRSAGLGVVFASNGSRHGPERIAGRLKKLGIECDLSEVVTAFDIAGEEIHRQAGPLRVLVVGTNELGESLARAGHTPLPFDAWRDAQAVVLGNDPEFNFERLRGASRVIAMGGSLFAVNLDARFPVGLAPDEFEPGCGALTEAILVASGTNTRPIVIGKPSRPLFDAAVARLGCLAAEAAMVGDSYFSDMAGGIAAGMFTVWLNADTASNASPNHPRPAPAPDVEFPNLDALRQAWLIARGQGIAVSV